MEHKWILNLQAVLVASYFSSRHHFFSLAITTVQYTDGISSKIAIQVDQSL